MMLQVTTEPGQKLDMVRFKIETGAEYDGPQIILAELEKAEDRCGIWELTFRIADDSRGIYELVSIATTWPLIRECQNDTATERGIARVAKRIFDEYLMSRYATY